MPAACRSAAGSRATTTKLRPASVAFDGNVKLTAPQI
jgi:hypothetical protein